jgi:hypothetical protein
MACRLPDSITDNLAIVKIELPADIFKKIQALYHRKYFYFAIEHNPAFSKFKDGNNVAPHITCFYGIYPIQFPNQAEFVKKAAEQASEIAVKCGSPDFSEGLFFGEATSWPPPKDAIARGEPLYHVVVITLEAKDGSFIPAYRKWVQSEFLVRDVYASSPKFHATVAYVLAASKKTNPIADEMVCMLNAQFRGKAVPKGAKLVVDDNGFTLYGKMS